MAAGSDIRVENVWKRWGSVTALHGVSFAAPAGSLTVLLGASGCGKSTLLRLVAGLDGVSDGRILIGGDDVTVAAPAERGVSMVFQNYALFPHLSVAENILFGLRVRKVSRAECSAKLARVAGLLGLDQLLARKPAQLSGGQQQRVAMGRAIVSEQPICLMDEPMSNLDAQLRAEMRTEIQSLQRTLGITMLYVTHDQVEAMSMADQVVLLDRGHVDQIASPADMYAAPASLFAARFIGTPPLNLVALEASPPGRRVIAGTGCVVLDQLDDRELLLGLRPEEIELHPDGVPAIISKSEFLGADTLLRCQLGSQTLQVRVSRLVRATLGESVGLRWRAESAHFFDRATGRRAEIRQLETAQGGQS